MEIYNSLKFSWVGICFALCSVLLVEADVSHLSTTEHSGPANPYVFSYQAGRYAGHVDRQHTEVSDGSGVVRGVYSFVDPKNQVRTVQYVADENGFHPQLSHATEDVQAVKLAKQKHINLYNRIAQEHAHAQAHPGGSARLTSAYTAGGPKASHAVVQATKKHLSEYERIAAEHAAIGAQRAAERKSREYEEAQLTHEHNPYQIPVSVHYE